MTMHIEHHIYLGNILKECSENLQRYMPDIPLGSQAKRQAIRSLNVLNCLCFELEKLLATDFAQVNDPREIKQNMYFGGKQYGLERPSKYDAAVDGFYQWKLIDKYF